MITLDCLNTKFDYKQLIILILIAYSLLFNLNLSYINTSYIHVVYPVNN